VVVATAALVDQRLLQMVQLTPVVAVVVVELLDLLLELQAARAVQVSLS
jgi:hypothetical protein